MNPPRPTAWLWWLAAIIAIGATVAVIALRRDTGNIYAGDQIRRVVMFAIIGIGLCVISATSKWWMNR